MKQSVSRARGFTDHAYTRVAVYAMVDQALTALSSVVAGEANVVSPMRRESGSCQ